MVHLTQGGEVAEDLKILEMIRMEIAGFMGTVSRMRLIPYDELAAGGYKARCNIVIFELNHHQGIYSAPQGTL